MAVLPVLNIGGMQIFRIQGGDGSLRRSLRVGATILKVYAGLTVALAVALWAAGMPRFDAVVHAMSTISTGGFGTTDASLGSFNSPTIDLIACMGMVLGGIPYLLFPQLARGRWRTILLPTPMSTAQTELPVKAVVYDRNGAEIAEHRVPGKIILHCLEGRVLLGLEQGATDLGANQWIYLEGSAPHSLKALEDTSLLLTIFFP